MSYGAGANYADVIGWQAIHEICPKEARAFTAKLDDLNEDFDSFCQMSQEGYDVDNDIFDALSPLWKNLQRAFTKATRVGKSKLTLGCCFHDQESEGDRYDEVSGGYLCVDGIEQLTPAGKKIGKKVERRFFVTYG